MGSLPIGLSASRAAAILGMSPWATSFSVWQDIMEARHPNMEGKGFNAARDYDYTPFEGNASTRWGTAFEDAVIKLAEERAGMIITDREGEYSASDLDYVTCHIDGAYKGNPVEELFKMETFPPRPPLHEGKTTTSYGYSDKWGEPGSDRIPVEYQLQVQHQMLCTGADECIVSVLVFPKRPEEWEAEGYEVIPQSDGTYLIGRKIENGDYKGCGHIIYPEIWAQSLAQMGFFHQYVVKSDPDLQSLMLDKYRVWWTKYVIGETPPAPANYADIRAMITAPVGTIIVDDQTSRWFKEYKDIGSEIGKSGNSAKRQEQLKTLILDHARGLESTLDTESTDKWIFMDGKGQKLGSYGRTKKGTMVFR